MSTLAPTPDFRHVTLVGCSPSTLPIAMRYANLRRLCAPLSCAASVAAFGAATQLEGWRGILGLTIAGAAGLLWLQLAPRAVDGSGKPSTIAIVPWGVIIEDGAGTRVLRWNAITGLDVETFYGRDQATDVTRHSVVVVDTGHERLVGRAPGAAPLDRLLAYREAYAREGEHVAAVDLTGVEPAGESWEPQVERLILTSRQLLKGGNGALDASLLGYRGIRAGEPTAEVVDRLREVLRDRTEYERDPRPLGALLAGELQLKNLAPELATLASSPHPLTAAAARAASATLGLRVGVLDEVAPFLPEPDVEALEGWVAQHAPSNGHSSPRCDR